MKFCLSQTTTMSDSHSVVKDQPEAIIPLGSERDGQHSSASTIADRVRKYKTKVSTREGWLGDYDYAWLCTPSLPRMKTRRLPPFYALDAELPILLAIACGLQHALAMLAGLITPPIIFASSLNLDSATQAYMVSASLIGCGK